MRGAARHRGYTIVEVVLVVVILAIVGTLAGPRFFDTGGVDERRYAEELAAALRYAQKVAVASGCRVRVSIAATSYVLDQQARAAGHCDATDTSFPVPVRLSTGEPMSGVAPGNVTVTPALNLVYNPLGQTNLTSNQVFAVGSRTLTVQSDSGLVLAP